MMSARALVGQWLGRAALLAFWSLVAWGTLLLFLTLLDVAGEGLRPALARLVPPHGASAWAWMNAVSVGLAIAVGLVVAGLAVSARRGGGEPPAS
jgi:hypothetical protein